MVERGLVGNRVVNSRKTIIVTGIVVRFALFPCSPRYPLPPVIARRWSGNPMAWPLLGQHWLFAGSVSRIVARIVARIVPELCPNCARIVPELCPNCVRIVPEMIS